MLRVLNRELGADFDVDAFTHVAVWDAESEWVEMWLRAERAMRVKVRDLDLTVTFEAGEQMCTEVSAKFRHNGVREMLAGAGFELSRWWSDPDERFGLEPGHRAPALACADEQP